MTPTPDEIRTWRKAACTPNTASRQPAAGTTRRNIMKKTNPMFEIIVIKPFVSYPHTYQPGDKVKTVKGRVRQFKNWENARRLTLDMNDRYHPHPALRIVSV